MIWDGIRAVDYLLTRKEVDPARIGITGRSGGGTQSVYIAALDDRIYAAAFSKQFDKVILKEQYHSYMSIISTRFYDPVLAMSGVAGALKEYDLADLVAALPPGTLSIIEALN